MSKKKRKTDNRQIVLDKMPLGGAFGNLRNENENWDIIVSDVQGSYTGTGLTDPQPVQDADDL